MNEAVLSLKIRHLAFANDLQIPVYCDAKGGPRI